MITGPLLTMLIFGYFVSDPVTVYLPGVSFL